jgi:hypothetical protein
MIEANAFDYLRDRERDQDTFDTIVLDPPAFAKNRGAVASALRWIPRDQPARYAHPAPRRVPVHRELQLPPHQAVVSSR